MKIRVLPEALFKLQGFIDNCDYEISGLGIVSVINGDPVIEDVFILEQEGAAAETNMMMEGIDKFLLEAVKTGLPLEKIRLWFHSHAKMQAFMSSTDVATINKLGAHMCEGNDNAWLLSVCGNHAGNFFARVDLFSPFRWQLEKIEVVEHTTGLAAIEFIDQRVNAEEYAAQYTARAAEFNALAAFHAEQLPAITEHVVSEIKTKVKEKPRFTYYMPPKNGYQLSAAGKLLGTGSGTSSSTSPLLEESENERYIRESHLNKNWAESNGYGDRNQPMTEHDAVYGYYDGAGLCPGGCGFIEEYCGCEQQAGISGDDPIRKGLKALRQRMFGNRSEKNTKKQVQIRSECGTCGWELTACMCFENKTSIKAASEDNCPATGLAHDKCKCSLHTPPANRNKKKPRLVKRKGH